MSSGMYTGGVARAAALRRQVKSGSVLTSTFFQEKEKEKEGEPGDSSPPQAASPSLSLALALPRADDLSRTWPAADANSPTPTATTTLQKTASGPDTETLGLNRQLVTGRYRFSDQSHTVNYVYVSEELLENDANIVEKVLESLHLPYQPELMLKLNMAEDALKWNCRVYQNPTLTEWLLRFVDKWCARHRLKRTSFIRQKVGELTRENAQLRKLVERKEKAFARNADSSQRRNTQQSTAKEVAAKVREQLEVLFLCCCGTLQGLVDHLNIVEAGSEEGSSSLGLLRLRLGGAAGGWTRRASISASKGGDGEADGGDTDNNNNNNNNNNNSVTENQAGGQGCFSAAFRFVSGHHPDAADAADAATTATPTPTAAATAAAAASTGKSRKKEEYEDGDINTGKRDIDIKETDKAGQESSSFSLSKTIRMRLQSTQQQHYYQPLDNAAFDFLRTRDICSGLSTDLDVLLGSAYDLHFPEASGQNLETEFSTPIRDCKSWNEDALVEALRRRCRLEKDKLARITSHMPEDGSSLTGRPRCEKLMLFERDLREELKAFFQCSTRYTDVQDLQEELPTVQEMNEYSNIRKSSGEAVSDRHARTKEIYRPRRALDIHATLDYKNKRLDGVCARCTRLLRPLKLDDHGQFETVRVAAYVTREYLELDRIGSSTREKSQWDKIWFVESRPGADDDEDRIVAQPGNLTKHHNERGYWSKEAGAWKFEEDSSPSHGSEGQQHTKPSRTFWVHSFSLALCCCTLHFTPPPPESKRRPWKNWDVDYVYRMIRKAQSCATQGLPLNVTTKKETPVKSPVKSDSPRRPSMSPLSPRRRASSIQGSDLLSDSDSDNEEQHDEQLYHYQQVVKENARRMIRGTVEACRQSKACLLLEPLMIQHEPTDVLADWCSEASTDVIQLCLGDSAQYVFPKESGEGREDSLPLLWGIEDIKKDFVNRRWHSVEKRKGPTDNSPSSSSSTSFEWLPRPETEDTSVIVINSSKYVLKRDVDEGGTGEWYRLEDDAALGGRWLPPPRATHLIMSSNPALLKAKLEDYIRCGLLIVNGGPATTRRFAAAVDKGEPVFCFKYTGGTADFVCQMVDQMEKERVLDTQGGSSLSREQRGPRTIPFPFLNDELCEEYREALCDSLDFVAPLSHSDLDACRQLNVLARNWPDTPANIMVIDFFTSPSVEAMQDELTKVLSSSESSIRKEERKRLAYAWRLRHFFLYNCNLQKANADFLNILAIILSFVTTCVAVVYTYCTSINTDANTGIFSSLLTFPGFTTERLKSVTNTTLVTLNILLPLVITVLKGAEKAFNPGAKAAAMEHAARSLESEIYKYRTKAGKYSTRRKARNAASKLGGIKSSSSSAAGSRAGNGARARTGDGVGAGAGAEGNGGKGAAASSGPMTPAFSSDRRDSPSAIFADEIERIWKDVVVGDVSKGAMVYPVLDFAGADVLKDINQRIQANRVVQEFLSDELPNDEDFSDLEWNSRAKQRERQWREKQQLLDDDEIGETRKRPIRAIVTMTANCCIHGLATIASTICSTYHLLCRPCNACLASCRSCRRACSSCRQCAKSCCEKRPGDWGERDDGISFLSAEDFVSKRLFPIIAEMTMLAPQLSHGTSFITFSIISLSVVSSVLSTFGLVNWIPVVLAMASALGAFSSYRMLDLRLSHTNGAIKQLHTIAVWWDSLSLIEKRVNSNKDLLVALCESAIESAHVGFVPKSAVGGREASSETPNSK